MSPSKNSNAAASLKTPEVPSAGQTPLSTATVPATTTGLLEVKDRRAFEHDRQRAHKPADRAHQRKAPRKAMGNAGRSAKYWTGGVSRGGNKRWDGFVTKADLDIAEDDSESDDGADAGETRADAVRLPVSLIDLIRPERKRNGISQGFELIPRLRPVMIIDDGAESEGEDEDEVLDWEVIPAPGVKHKTRAKHAAQKRSSYAAVLRTSAMLKS